MKERCFCAGDDPYALLFEELGRLAEEEARDSLARETREECVVPSNFRMIAAAFIHICRAGRGRALQLFDTAVRLLWCFVCPLVPFLCARGFACPCAAEGISMTAHR
eukprot:COSAG06_NODE_886_length_11771_cov_13.431203_14_plen_107_part_00